MCSRHTWITAALSGDERDADAITRIMTGRVPHAGWRIDLLSYGTARGWRPFVPIKGALGSEVPDAPSVLWSLYPSRAEADHEALEAAKRWIGKRFTA